MKIREITIKNFRSVKNAKLATADFTVLIGPNNSGKSNILHALEFFFTPTMRINADDYPYGESEIGDNSHIEVEISFEKLTANELRLFDAQKRTDGTLVLKRVASTVNSHEHNNGYRSVIDNGDLVALPDNLITPGKLPEFFFVPALFDIRKELTVSRNTYLGRLINRYLVLNPTLPLDASQTSSSQQFTIDPHYLQSQNAGLAKLEQLLNDDLSFFDGKVRIEAPNISVAQLYELGTRVTIDDGAKTDASRKGHGLQRALVFAFIRQWVNALRDHKEDYYKLAPHHSESVIFAIEEPEMNIHPHGIRKIAKDLRDLAASQNHQVFACSHSPQFVDLKEPKAIAVVGKAKTEQGTQIQQCLGELFAEEDDRKEAVRRFNATGYFNPDRSELFFAEHIILVEGQTEAKLLPLLGEKLGVFRLGCSIIDCDGKYNLRLYMEVLNKFGLPYVVLHDEDPLPQPPESATNAQKGIFNENNRIAEIAKKNLANRILVSQPNFEAVAEISIEPNKPFSAYEAFKDKENHEIPARLAELVRNAFNTENGGRTGTRTLDLLRVKQAL